MPAGTKVDQVYQALLKKGYDKGKAARIAQSETGEALATGRPPKHALKTANTAEAEDRPERKPREASKYPTYAVAAANASEDADMIRPSSERVNLSSGSIGLAGGRGFYTRRNESRAAKVSGARYAGDNLAREFPARRGLRRHEHHEQNRRQSPLSKRRHARGGARALGQVGIRRS